MHSKNNEINGPYMTETLPVHTGLFCHLIHYLSLKVLLYIVVNQGFRQVKMSSTAVVCILSKCWFPAQLLETCCWLCFHTERHQLSLVRWQWHRVHTLGLNWWWRRHRDRRLCVHGRQRRLAKSRLRHPVARSPLWWSPSKSVLLQ